MALVSDLRRRALGAGSSLWSRGIDHADRLRRWRRGRQRRRVPRHLVTAVGSAPICPEPIFIIGSPRSATTALAWALAEHSHLWTSPESQILADLFSGGELDRNYARTDPPDGSWLRSQGISREDFLGHLGLGLNALFTRQSGGRRWIDHTPFYTLMVDDLVGLFPGARFVHILRDGRAAVHSMINYQYNAPFRGDIAVASQWWTQYVSAALDAADRYPERVLTVRNEALRADPAPEFAAIFAHLRLPPEPEPAAFFGRKRVHSSFAPATRPGIPWLDWPRKHRRVFVDEAGAMLVRCGYATDRELADWLG